MISIGNKGTGASMKRSGNVGDDREPPDEIRVKQFTCKVKTAKVGLTVQYHPTQPQAERLGTKYVNMMQDWFHVQR